jgi:hypothetical protein
MRHDQPEETSLYQGANQGARQPSLSFNLVCGGGYDRHQLTSCVQKRAGFGHGGGSIARGSTLTRAVQVRSLGLRQFTAAGRAATNCRRTVCALVLGVYSVSEVL